MSKAKSATYGDYHIRIDEQGTVKVYQKSTHKECPSAIAALREIANKIGYRYGDWNTRHFGAKLVEYLSSNPQLINVETPKVTTPKEEVVEDLDNEEYEAEETEEAVDEAEETEEAVEEADDYKTKKSATYVDYLIKIDQGTVKVYQKSTMK